MLKSLHTAQPAGWSMVFKYAEDIGWIEDCPPMDAEPKDCPGFRFVHATIEDKRNFLPPAKLNPQRRFRNAGECCAGHALSMFDTQEHARAFYMQKRLLFKRIEQTLGTHIAKGSLCCADGYVTPTRSDGHFDLFECEGLDLSRRFDIVEELRNA